LCFSFSSKKHRSIKKVEKGIRIKRRRRKGVEKEEKGDKGASPLLKSCFFLIIFFLASHISKLVRSDLELIIEKKALF